MAVQKSKKSKARAKMRRAHNQIAVHPLVVDPTTGELVRRHHVTGKGFYKGKAVLEQSSVEQQES